MPKKKNPSKRKSVKQRKGVKHPRASASDAPTLPARETLLERARKFQWIWLVCGTLCLFPACQIAAAAVDRASFYPEVRDTPHPLNLERQIASYQAYALAVTMASF